MNVHPGDVIRWRGESHQIVAIRSAYLCTGTNSERGRTVADRAVGTAPARLTSRQHSDQLG